MPASPRPVLLSLLLSATLFATLPPASAQHTAAPAPEHPAADSAPDPAALAATQDQLINLVRMSPTLTDAVRIDPTLLSDQEYVTRQNPALAQFLQLHPEVARNPDFYLFADLPRAPDRRGHEILRRNRVFDPREREPAISSYVREVGPFVVLVIVLATLLWLTRSFLENRRWSRVFKTQTEVHTHLIERFGSNAELLTYMNTESGRRFLEAAPIPIGFEQDRRVPATLGRVLLPLQIGIVLTLLGTGLLLLRNSIREISSPLLVLGVIVLMPGLGFILSAGVTWIIAARLGLTQPVDPELSRPGDRV